jgi:hypothetical protein
MQKEALSLPWRATTLFFNELTTRNGTVKTTEKIQHPVINANMEVVMARRHFVLDLGVHWCCRLLKQVLLFHHKNP